MPYQVLARKYRPQRFQDVAGQDHVTVTLMNALTQGRIAHGYIFSGHRGIGKTTVARILAMALNCRTEIGTDRRPTAEPCETCESCTEIRAGNAVDVIEIDAATNRGIDEIRELRDAARYRPARDKYKIYILDEAHQITDAAFNALLKTLEEPPEHIVFMMATTQPEDIPQTVRSRCQHFSFHAVKMLDILAELRGIAEHENVDADESSLALLAEAGDGSMRDALSIMDQAIASATIEDGRPRLDPSQIRELMGAVPNTTLERIFEAVDGNRSAEVMAVANDLMDAGNSPAQLARQCLRYLRNCLMAKISNLTPEGLTPGGSPPDLLQISPDEQRRAARTAHLFTEEELTRFLQVMLRTFDELGYRQEQRFHFELGLLKLVHLRRLLPIEEILSRLPAPVPAGNPALTRPTAAAPTLANPSRAELPAATSASSTRPSSTIPAAAPAKPAFSPFQADASRKRFEAPAPAPPKPAPAPAAKPVAEVPRLETAPKPPAPPPAPAPSLGDLSTQSTAPALTAEDLQARVVEALQAAPSQSSAADALADSTWTIAGPDLRVETTLSKMMLPMVINPDADRIARQTLREAGAAHLRLDLLPGRAATTSAAPKKPRSPRSGTAQSKAEEHPIVQQAQRLFHAEIRKVIDLSTNE